MKKVSFCSSLALSTDTSFIEVGLCHQKLSTLEFNFHYRLSSHYLYFTIFCEYFDHLQVCVMKTVKATFQNDVNH